MNLLFISILVLCVLFGQYKCEAARMSPVGAAVVNFEGDNTDDSSDTSPRIEDNDNIEVTKRKEKSRPIPSNSVSQSSLTNGIQYMITNRMRQVLEDELGYLSSEVDRMEPQIAAIVIDKRLSRPSKGMPASWTIPAAISSHVPRRWGSSLNLVTSSFRYVRRSLADTAAYAISTSKSLVSRSYGFIRVWAPTAVPVLSAAIITPYLYSYYYDMDFDGESSMPRFLSLDSLRSLSPMRLWGSKKAEPVKKTAVDMRAYRQAASVTWADKISNAFRRS